jgi:hypothetical protein
VDSPGRPYRADWYPDPTHRFEFRYHNGQSWTADVSLRGVRYVDPVATSTTQPAEGRRDRLATAARVLGIVGICLSWTPVFFVIGVVASVLALVFGLVARRRTPDDTRGFAGAGILTGAGGIVLAGVGVWTTWLVIDAVDDYLDPPPADVTVARCATDGGVLYVEGSLHNVGSADGDYRVVVRVPGSGLSDRDVAIDVGEVAAGATADFAEQIDVSRSIDPVPPDCDVMQVTGPLPFGIDVGLDPD